MGLLDDLSPVLGQDTYTALKRLVLVLCLAAGLNWLRRFICRRMALSRLEKSFVTTPKGSQSFKFVSSGKVPTIPDIAAVNADMRASFSYGNSRPLAVRVSQIKALRRLFVENEQLILAALKADLHRPEFEALYYDFHLPLSEIDHMLAALEDYVLPERKGFNILTFPSVNEVHKEPLGTVLVIGTWNYPIMLSLVPLLGAIAAGNTVVLKPCNVAPATAQLMADLIPRYLDPTIVYVVGTAMQGDRGTTTELLKYKWDHIFFTGSPSVGRVIMEGAAKFLTPCTLELGGKNPVFVDSNSNLDLAAKRVVWGRMMNAGQQCIAPDYCLVHEKVIDEFGKLCAKWAVELYGSSTATKDNGNLGRIVGDKQMERLAGLLTSHGGEVVCGGQHDIAARWIAPTVLKVPMSSPTMEEETFGPILLLTPVPSMAAAVDYVNARPKPLSLYLFSDDKATQDMIVSNTSSGGVTINACLFHAAHPELPFGGVGDSGAGAYHGRNTFETFVHRRPVLRKIHLPDLGLLSDPFFIYPPWTPLKRTLLKLLAPLL